MAALSSVSLDLLAETELPPVVVTANKQEVPYEDVAASVTLITRDDIKKQNAATVPEVLRNVVGTNITATGSPGDDVDVRIRGADRDEVLIMIDGVPINDVRERRASSLGAIPLDSVERIEVVRGSQSVLYGSDAVGGVINIITRKGGDKNRVGAWFEGGNLQTFREGVEASGSSGKLQYSGSFSRTDQRGRFARDRFSDDAVSANIGYQILPSLEVEAGVNYLRDDQDLFYEFQTMFDPTTMGLIVNIDPDNDSHLHRDSVVGHATVKATPKSWWRTQLDYGFLVNREHLTNSDTTDTAPPGFTPGVQDFHGNEQRHTVDVRNFFTLYDTPAFSSQMTVGFEFEDEKLRFTDPPTVFPAPGQKGSRQNYAPYVQNSFHFLDDSLILTGGVRFDHNTTWGSEWSPAASILYKLKKTGTTFRGSYGEGFHGPTILDFFNQVLLKATGDPSFQAVLLQPELSRSYEVGVDQRIGPADGFPRALVSATFFFIDYDRLFDALQFINNAFSTGLESGVSIEPVSWLKFGGNYTFLDAINQDNHTRLADRPRNQGNVFVQAEPLPHLDVRADVNIVSSRKIPSVISTSAGDLGVTFVTPSGSSSAGGVLPGYTKVDLAASYDILRDRGALEEWKLYFKIENLLNRSYQEKFGFPAPGITFLAGTKATF